jgi:hypothetical protein
MAGTYQAISEMGAVEVLEPHDRAYFTAYIIDIQEGGKKTLVRSVLHADVFAAAGQRRAGGRSAAMCSPP